MSAKPNAPVIIKRKKIIAGGGHHGGAWKVAYADFVTAMMAFFMLMWLLNATTETQRKGLADYFSPSIPIMRVSGGGDGTFGGDNVFTKDSLAQSGETPGAESTSIDETSVEDRALESVKDALSAKTGESMVGSDLGRHILTRVTDEGMIVELFDLPGEPLFFNGSSKPTELMQELVGAVAEVFGLVENKIAVNGHTRAEPIVLVNNPVWDLSASRANEVRMMILDAGLKDEKLQRIAGFADKKLSVRNPMSVRNNRIELILLRKDK